MQGLELFEYTGHEIRVQVPGGGVRVQTWVLPKGQSGLRAERAEAS